MKNKVLYINSTFTKELPTATDTIDSIYIEGYASTNDTDRSGDVVPASVWQAGIKNYLKNPIILSQHDHDDPIGRMVEHKVDSTGLWIKARISAAAEVFSLVKDGVLTAFSVGFRVMDAEYNAVTELFVIKELELVEISVVSVPCNQNTLFSLSKAFPDADEYKNFKSQFAPKSESAKGLESSTEASSKSQKEWKMNPEEIKQLVADAARLAAEQTTKAFAEATAKQKAEEAAKASMEAEIQIRIKAALAAVTPTETGTERLLAEVEKRFAQEAESTKSKLEGLQAVLAEKAAELEAIQKSKMSFSDNKAGEISYSDREKAIMLATITGKSMQDTKFGKQLVEKFGAHLPTATWELEVSMNMESEVRRKLVVAPILRNISMQTNVMTIPVNPEATYATWIQNNQFGGAPATLGAAGPSAGATVVHQLKEVTLNAYKLATNEYMAYEEEEDSLLALMPIVRDAMIRRTAKSIDRAFLIGAGTGGDPVKGLAVYAGVSAVTTPAATAVTVANMRALRKALGALGLDPNEVTFIVNTDTYYNLLEDTTFQTMNQVGPQATLLTGQIGQIGNSPVLVTAELPAAFNSTNLAATTTNVGALAIYKNNFLVGNQRGLRMDTQELVETQRRVLVASMRTGMTQIATNLGAGVAALRYVL
ncbi:major_cap_HK97, phage major capsid protein, HK97 family [uncultured Caudovirales phage]|uniref:Major_cap_HK97, phage major capsid protein, HK97 family n=1 Tax=uncultured Caudovirales phage TaxID=2100421 RepID=A0A6J7XHY2_9CAUD|nr:major_cap_HK97, phage major capsid protein, HK97 family [uncultured Caudovirales phage]CAB4185308.1 major_cap_HK97, phage major capsid protein, HK97 family [uncultured Caudovirales phage]CAB4193539.1 major_cap_HK97, phage major capsid protein, HK97 family [uncultured Caudovirales phage]CAB4215983.1 major_cap_HK97, phage major capsid protein, HK97 family [uncultured Caudovirales phage]CAB5230690.1 major_cap_HK97, phage major capsid protein, HK97 family [uncultured Caudovirales phage]